MKMAPFPSPLERIVASALLLLTSTANPPPLPPPLSPPSPSPPELGFEDEAARSGGKSKSGNYESLSLVSSGENSCSSSLTSDDGSSKDNRENKLKIFAVVAQCHEMKLKVAKKKRSQVSWGSGNQKNVLALPAKVTSSMSTSTECSCLSSTSSAVSSARSCYIYKGVKGKTMMAPKSKQVGSAHMRRQAEEIRKFLSSGCSSEVRIRQALGDSPDTSKALRMLLRKEEVKRSGTGGRQDPYIYKIA